MTRIQRITIALLIGFFFWELAIRIWASNLPDSDPLIRVDLLVIVPVVLIFLSISVKQWFSNRNDQTSERRKMDNKEKKTTEP